MKILQEKLREYIRRPGVDSEKRVRLSELIDELPRITGNDFHNVIGFIQGLMWSPDDIDSYEIFLDVLAYTKRQKKSQWRVVWHSRQGPVRMKDHNTKASALVELAEWRARCSPDLKFSLVRVTIARHNKSHVRQ